MHQSPNLNFAFIMHVLHSVDDRWSIMVAEILGICNDLRSYSSRIIKMKDFPNGLTENPGG